MPDHQTNEPAWLDIGPCIVEYKGAVLGATVANPEGGTHGGCAVRHSVEFRNSHRDIEGTNEHDAIVVGTMVEIQCNFTGLSLTQLASVMPGAAISSASTTHKRLNISNAVGSSMRAFAGELILKQAEDGAASADTKDWLKVPLAYPMPELDFAFDLENQKVYTVTFRGLVAPSTGLIAYWGADVSS